ncbi:PKD-like domain-containing protein [Gillisia sp. Q332]|uniref:Ig-like domain-containing protein n=1 Tax=Gillisia xinjiangensis TaxID=3384765 RepID=UPI00391AB044
MEKKLLCILFIFSLFFLNPVEGFGQACPSTVSISADTGNTICAGTPVTFTANANGGTGTFTYQWKIDGVNAGTNSNTFPSSSLNNGDKVTVTVTSSDDTTCSTTSSNYTMTVNTNKTPTVTIAASKTSICPGESITFTASNTNGGTSPQYAWYINSSSPVVKTGALATFSASDFVEGNNTVRVVLTSNINCADPSTAEATSATFELKPDATISTPANHDQPVCINKPLQNIVFDLGGGATNATVTGLPPGVTGSLSGGNYVLSGSPTANGVFSYTVLTTGSCAQKTATGTITVNPDATIALTSGNNTQTVCAAGGVADGSISPITYSIGQTGTGGFITGLPSGITGSFSNGVFTIQGSTSETGTHNYSVNATGTCGDSAPLTGSIIITENKNPSVTISSNDADNSICAETSVSFNATPTNGGTNPTYQWKVNGTNVGTNSSTFTTTALTDGQIITVEMSSSETCLITATATSNAITTTVNPNLTPEVTIVTSDSDICPTDPVTFTATPVNEGTNPSYQWKIGNTNVGANSPTFTTSTLMDGQVVTVTMTSSETCLATITATSNSIETNVNPDLIPSVTISSNDNNNILCSGSSITFTATSVNGGGTPSYQWKADNNNVGTNNSTFTTSSLTNGQVVTVVITASNDICLGDVISAKSNEIPVQVDNFITSETPQWDNSNPAHNPTAICPSVSGLKYKVGSITGATSYDWTLPSGWSITNGQGSNEITVTASVNASAGNITVNGRSECGTTQSISLPVTTGTAAHVGAGPDQTVCPGTIEINLDGEIGGVITQKKDWNWSDNGAGGTFKNNQGSDLKGIYTIPSSLRNGGTVTIRIQSVKPAGSCDIKTDEMIITIQSAAAITDPTNKNQTVCINSEITSIPFTITGAGTGATATGLPAGVSGNYENGVFTLSGTPTESGTFNYTVTTTGNCTNATRTGALTVNPRPTFTQPGEVFVCAGAQTSTISFGGSSVSGTTYQWTNDNISIGLADSGNGDINGFAAVNNTNEPVVANIIVTPTANNCEGPTQEFQITVYPTATFTTPADLTVCNGENLENIVFGGSNISGTTYKWSNSNTSIGLAAEGTGNISTFSVTNTTTEPIEATITVTPIANGCDGTPEEFTITVNPTPAFTAPENIVVCNEETLAQLDFSGATVTGTTFSWTNTNTAIGLAASGTGNLPSFTADNNGNEPISATISVIPGANGCDGEPVTFEIIVNPASTVNTIEDVIVCNGEDFSEIVLSSNVNGTSYSWTNSNTAIGLAETGMGNIPAFSAQNSTEVAINATITVIPTANDCEGTPYTFDITVNPSAIAEAGPDQTICSNGVGTMAATLGGGASEGIWTTNGSGTFNNNSINSEYTPSDSDVLNGSVILTFTSNNPDGPCGTASDTMELFINEEVLITTQPENIGICSTEPSELTIIASGDNLSYQWKRTDGAIITNSNGIYSSTLSFNNTTSTHAGEYYVVVRGEDVCNDEDNPVESARVTINVDENIIIDEPSAEVPICGDGFSEATMKFIAHAGNSPLAFAWYKDGVPVDATDSKITINEAVLNSEGKYEGSLQITGVTVDYNGDYYVEITGPEEFTCSTAVTNPFQLRLNDMPALPEVEDLVVCQNEIPEAFTVNLGTNLKWYLNENDENFIANDAGQPTAPIPATNTPGDFYYWVTQQPEACESEKVQVKVTVKEKPSVPALTSEEAVIEYCLGEIAVLLTATGNSNTILNWYDSETGEALTSAPQPNTENPGVTTYWVSQTPNNGLGCESDRASITVTVYSLPEVTASVEENIICFGSPAELTATGGVTYTWYNGEEVIGNEASISHIPTEAGDYTFNVFVTDANGCENTAEVTVKVDETTIAGTISGQESVCISSPSGSFILEGNTGEIQHWESSTDGGTNWSEITNTSATLDFADLATNTIFRAIVKNGVCEEMASNQVEVTIDPLPVGGDLAFAGNGRVFTICENATGNYAVDLNLTGTVGDVVRWGYRSWDATGYTTLTIGGEVFTGNTLTAVQIQTLGFNETTVFQVEVSSGACVAPALSKTAILSVIPSDIKPSPVTVEPGVVCLGEEVTLSSETGYENGGTFLDQGAFDNASITNHGWRIRREGISGDLGFDTDANNTEFDRWKRATPRAFTTASVNSPFSTSGVVFDTGIEDGNKGFGLISGNYRSTMETPIFTIGSTDQAILTFDQAYVLTPGSSLQVEISTDGGNTYTTLYIREVPANATQGIASGNTTSFGTGTIDSHPENKILIDLGDYMGRPNLRIRFNYSGARPGDIWAVDNIDIPEGPNGITMEWRDYTDPAFPDGILIGTNNSENYTPIEIGLNTFEVKTKLVYNSSGDACEVAENAQRIEVFVFDKYTTSVTASYGTCGNFNVQLTANVLDGKGEPVTSFPTPDGYIGKWIIDGGTLVDSDPDDGIDAINDPNAILSAPGTGSYTVSWILEPTELDENGDLYINPEACPPIVTPLDVVIEGCIALDFDGFNDYVDLGTNYTGSNYSIEAWIRPFDRELEESGLTDASSGTIISGPGFEIKMEDLPATISPNSRWYHIAYTSDDKLYIDGFLQSSNSITGAGGSKTLIGARWNSSEKEAENHFSGWIEEVRIWNGAITEKNIQFTMNQRLKGMGNIGVVVDMDHPDAPDYANLSGYYQLISAIPDPEGLVTYDDTLKPINGFTIDLAITAVPGRLINMSTNQQNTAPLPYFSGSNNSWDIATTWARPDVWKIPNTGGIDWNIVKTSHNITADRAITVLGLISEVNTLDMLGTIPTAESHLGVGTGNALTISHYLRLDGIIDLNGESQLLQPELSIVDEASSGYLDRDQQGKRNSFIYNYWSSPVSISGTNTANNGGYSVGGVLLDGTNPAAPDGINFQDYHGAADGTRQSPIIVSTYWLWGYSPAAANIYAEWDHILENGTLKTGEGFTMKGTAGDAALNDGQNYTFRGKPHNGDITLTMGGNQNYLIGNPYPSAIDADQFIQDYGTAANPVFDGSIYFWDHFVVVDHILKEYIGGYATYNLTGGVSSATSSDDRINDNMTTSGKLPQQYIPVGQGFLINSTDPVSNNGLGGDIIFKNSYRVFKKESTDNSIFLKPEIVEKTAKSKNSEFQKIRLSFSSPIGYRRQILVGAVPGTTDGFDLGYDANLFDDNVEDIYWIQGNNKLVIQGVPDFNKERVLPLGVKIKEEKEFTIRIDTVENAPNGMKVYLNDKLNDSIHDLRKSAYSSTSEPGFIHDRFEIIFYKDEPLPPVTEVPGEDPIEIKEEFGISIRHGQNYRELQILNPHELSITNMYIFDLNGNKLEGHSNLPGGKEFKMPVRNYSSGVYIVQIVVEGRVVSKKIIISN